MTSPSSKETPVTGLVLSGGGARGAYEMGIVLGIVEALELGPEDPTPFPVLCGTSIGSINAGWIAACSDRGCLDETLLTREWTDLSLEHYLRVEPANLMFSAFARDEAGSRSFLNPEPFEQFAHSTPWERVQQNLSNGALQALLFTALELGTGRTVWFTQMGCDRSFPDWLDHRRTVLPTTIGPEHMLASSAIPLALPPRRIGDHFYSDGGARFKTPIAAAIRAGAERLVVITLRNAEEQGEQLPDDGSSRPLINRSPPPLTLMGQILGALSFDTARYDIARLKGINQLVDALERELEAEQLQRVQQTMALQRGAAWRKIPVLCFEPTLDFGEYALHKARELMQEMPWRQRWFLQLMEMTGQGNVLSFLFFDRIFTEGLVARGKQDALKRADEIRAFFD